MQAHKRETESLQEQLLGLSEDNARLNSQLPGYNPDWSTKVSWSRGNYLKLDTEDFIFATRYVC